MSQRNEFAVLDRRAHDTRRFDCGKKEQTEYLRRYAAKNNTLNLSRTFVLPVPVATSSSHAGDKSGDKLSQRLGIAAYYTLVGASVDTDLPLDARLPRYSRPVVLLARLAVDRQYQGHGLGTSVLIHALRHAEHVTTGSRQSVPALGVVLDVADDDAMQFYRQFDWFLPMPGHPMRLFVSMKSIQQL